MALPIPRWTKGAPDRMVDKNRAGRSHLGHDVQSGADHQRWNSGVFNHMCDETDGLMTKRSVRDQQGQVHTGFGELLRNRGCEFVFDLWVAAHPP